ncbi:MAG: aldolase/citrate lyase family protein [Armatimonadota bacterium]|nr:aldolase/citrate lyase family protein [Armatimonadota bacterium]
MASNPVKQALARGEAVVGTMVGEWASPGVCRIVREAGYDFVIFDTEHQWPGLETVAWLMRTARDIGLQAYVRAPAFRGQWPARYLDLGCDGLIFPHVETGEQAQAIVDQVKFAPMGKRGLGTSIAHDDYSAEPAADFTRRRNEDTLVAVQIETATGLERREEILAAEGIDAVFIGPNDLSLSLGIPGQLDDPKVVGAIEQIFAAAQQASVAPGMHAFDVEMSLKYLDAGCRFLCFASEVALFVNGSREALGIIRGHEAVSEGVYS